MAGSKVYNIAITGLNATDNPGPGIAVARCLKEHKDCEVYTIGLGYDAFEPGILDNQIIDKAYLIPYPRVGKHPLLERILDINQKEKIDVIIPNLDSEFLNFIQIKKELEENGIRLFLPSEKQFLKRSKINIQKLCADIGIKTLKTQIINNISDIYIKYEEFPLMVKGALYEAYLAQSHEQVVYYTNRITAKWGFPILLQEYAHGEGYNACVVADTNGKTKGIVCMKKLILTDKGKGWACVSIKNNLFLEVIEKIMSSLKWTGAMEIEAIYSKKDDSFYLLELNPRFPSWIYLTKEAGINLPLIYIQLAMGNKVSEIKEYKTGLVLTNYTTNIVTELSKIDSLVTKGEISYEKNL